MKLLKLAYTAVRHKQPNNASLSVEAQIRKQEALRLIASLLKLGVAAKPAEVSLILKSCYAHNEVPIPHPSHSLSKGL